MSDPTDTDADQGQGEGTNSSQGLDPQAKPSDEEIKEIEEEREQRLDPENRPDHAEIDNTGRDFDMEKGEFADGQGGVADSDTSSGDDARAQKDSAD